tara:strand:- start:510 stop:1181 length:672 start_codon:yes stop_codon:yes gene_type:complete
MKQNTKEILQELNKLCSSNFEQLHQQLNGIQLSVQKLEKNMKSVEKRMKNVETKMVSNTSIHNIDSCENKIDFLNQNCSSNVLINETLSSFMSKHITFETKQVIDILKGRETIYNVCCEQFVSMVHYHKDEYTLIKILPFDKKELYIWDKDANSWSKIQKNELKDLFNKMQFKLIALYNQLNQNNDDSMKDIDIVDCSGKLFVDNFDKKCSDFKKLLHEHLAK